MYIPSLNQMTDRTEIIDFIRKYSFGTIISIIDGKPVATHLPFLVEERNEKLFLKSHFAKANPQAFGLENPLVIFSEPHAYISPSNYEKEQNVPTWNYLAVHIYGNPTLITEYHKVMALLDKTILTYEETFKAQYEKLPSNYKDGLAKGIVAFEIEVTEIQAKKKLSQNKTETERRNIIDSLSKSQDSVERSIADYMKISIKD
jgi:transcriptional regulator